MYCSECGSSADGKFCWNCGSKLQAGVSGPLASIAAAASIDEAADLVFEAEAAPAAMVPAGDWSHEIIYQKLLAIPAIRERIAAAGRQHKPGVSGEQCLKLYDALIPGPVKLEKLCVALQPIYGRLGIKTGKSLEQPFAAPAGRVLAATLCSLAAHGHEMKTVEQASDGCALHTVIPSSVWALEGELLVSIQRRPHDTLVSASTAIAGQMFDWGHSRRVLDRVFEGIRLEFGGPPPLRSAA